jgi:hypothetical protein
MRNGVSQSGCGREVKRDDALAHDHLERSCLAGLGACFLDGGRLDGLGRIGEQGQDGVELCLGCLGESLDRLDGVELAGLGQAGLAGEHEGLIFSSLLSIRAEPDSPRRAKAMETIELT